MLVVAVLAGCGAYKVAASPAPVSAENARGADETLTRTEVGCVEVGVDRRADREMAPVVRYAVANHCTRPVSIDLAWATVIGRTADGSELALVAAPSDPSRSSATIPPNSEYETTLAYTSAATIGQLCVDVASITRTPETVATTWRCFGNVVSVTMR